MSLTFIRHPSEGDLALFAGGELGLLARWRIEKHLQRCEACQSKVADFFYLQSEVSDLANLPAVDWDGMAQGILERAEQEQPPAAPEISRPGLLGQPVMLRAGLALATAFCAFVVIRQFPLQDSPQQASSRVAFEQEAPAAKNELLAEGQREVDDLVAPGAMAVADAPQEPEPFENAQVAQSKRAQEELLGEKKESDVARSLAFRGRYELPRDKAAPVPPETVPQASASSLDPIDRLGGANRRTQLGERAESSKGDVVGGAIQPITTQQRQGRGLGFARMNENVEGFRDEASLDIRGRSESALRKQRREPTLRADAEIAAQASPEVAEARAAAKAAGGPLRRPQTMSLAGDFMGPSGFAIQPAALRGNQVDVGVATDGSIQFRSVDAETGHITITHVYAP